MARLVIPVGSRYGRLKVLGPAPDRHVGKRKSSKSHSRCLCDCGQITETGNSGLVSGRTKSCGCVQRERAREQARHGHNSRVIPRTSEYNSWATMLARVRNPNNPGWKYYGGRGITVCKEWEDFAAFLADMGLKPGKGYSIDRIDNDGNYCPENCRWATIEQQLENRSSMRRLTFYGMTKTIREWSAISGNTPKAIQSRLENGWPPKYAVWANKGSRLKKVLPSSQES